MEVYEEGNDKLFHKQKIQHKITIKIVPLNAFLLVTMMFLNWQEGVV